ncbi:hypothetical protein PHJA_002765100 [Phtheirospermum japonicum]|uniref:S-protein homolog n=1 Tax=Phtheirospermum japonicum TaxID=374723 RepID=A0A830D242_9LAMI|nr:hypothetical protein PHJA_002765100 [Phtheirospermum japonicum]
MSYTIEPLLQFLVISFLLLQAKGCWIGVEKSFFVLSKLPANSPPLRIRCQSGDRDLGSHRLATDHAFSYKFCSNFRTLYFCHVYWNGKDKAFDVFRHNWTDQRCADAVCYWEVRSDGIYRSDNFPPKTITKAYDW